MSEEKNTTEEKDMQPVEETVEEVSQEEVAVEASTDESVEENKDDAATSDDDTVAAPKKKKAKKGKKHVPRGRAYVKATYNNTIVTFTDPHGNVLAQSSAGRCGFKGPKKSTPFAAGVVVKEAAEKVKDFGLKDIDVFIKGIGSGRDGALRAINSNGFAIMSIRDITPTPHNGCRPKKPRRV